MVCIPDHRCNLSFLKKKKGVFGVVGVVRVVLTPMTFLDAPLNHRFEYSTFVFMYCSNVRSQTTYIYICSNKINVHSTRLIQCAIKRPRILQLHSMSAMAGEPGATLGLGEVTEQWRSGQGGGRVK